MCRLRNIATGMCDYQESTCMTTGQTDAGRNDPYVPLCSEATQK